MLGSCQHLQSLSLVRTELALGAGEALSTLADGGSQGLALTLEEVVEVQLDEGCLPYHFLSSLTRGAYNI
jgi:hypothetical protein